MSVGASTATPGHPAIGTAARKNSGVSGCVRGGFRDDGVVDVDHRQSLDVLHRRQLVHPSPVVPLVMRMMMRGRVAGEHQCGLDGGQLRLGNENVDVGKEAAARRRQVGDQVPGALQQDHREAKAVDGAQNLAHFARDGPVLRNAEHRRRLEMLPRSARNVDHPPGCVEAMRQRAQQIGLPRPAHQLVPVRWIGERAIGVAQRLAEHAVRLHRTRARSSKTAMASLSCPPYRNSRQSLAATTSARMSKPRRPSTL